MPACVIERSNIHGGISVTCYAPGWNVDQGALKIEMIKMNTLECKYFFLKFGERKNT